MSINAQRNINILVAILGLVVLSILVFMGNKIAESPYKIITISYMAVFCGVLFESLRISEDWKTVFYITIASLILSLLGFLPGKHEAIYDFESHVLNIPFVFLLVFMFLTSLFNTDRVTVKLSEGITLLQSISIVYWLLDYGIENISNWGVIILISIVLGFSFYSLVHSLSHIRLTRNVRFILSVWSSIIMLVFGIDYIYRVLRLGTIEESKFIMDEISLFVQYFLLGVSSIYIVRNIILLLGFFPGKGSFFNRKHKNEILELRKVHSGRYSDQQVNIGHSILCILVTGTFYWINYSFNFFPKHTAIWLAFMLFSIIMNFIYSRKGTQIAYTPQRKPLRRKIKKA
jgi:hypothetical protein